jgi:hypothetical protein
MPIKKNENARKNLIDAEVQRVVDLCQEAADKGLNSIMHTMPKDIQRDVRDILEEEHDIFVPTKVYCGLHSPPSHKIIEHYGDVSEMKLRWR